MTAYIGENSFLENNTGTMTVKIWVRTVFGFLYNRERQAEQSLSSNMSGIGEAVTTLLRPPPCAFIAVEIGVSLIVGTCRILY